MSEEHNGSNGHHGGVDLEDVRSQNKQPAEADRVDKIRDLLFGEQMVGYDERFASLEKRLDDKYEALSDKIDRRLDDLKHLMTDRANTVEEASVKRTDLADKLESIASLLRKGND